MTSVGEKEEKANTIQPPLLVFFSPSETVDIDINGFTFPIGVVVMEMKGLYRSQMILGRPFLATTRAIINVDQGEIIIRNGKDYINNKVSWKYRYLKQNSVSKEESNLKVENQEKIKEPEGQGSQEQVRNIHQAWDVKKAPNRSQTISSS